MGRKSNISDELKIINENFIMLRRVKLLLKV